MSSDIIRLLWGAIPDSQKTVADRVLRAEGKPLHEQLAILTEVERTPGLPVNLFGLVAAAKQALTGKNFEKFRERVWRESGLL